MQPRIKAKLGGDMGVYILYLTKNGRLLAAIIDEDLEYLTALRDAINAL